MRKPQLSLLAVSVSVASMLLASTTTFAHGNYKENYKGEAMPCPVELVLRDGLYIGLQAGYDSYRLATDADSFPISDPILGETVTADPRLAANGAVGGLFIGYGKYFPEFYNTYLGLEIFGNWTAASTDYEITTVSAVTNNFLSTDVNIKNNYGISAMPGIKLNNATLLYVRLGYNWARIDYDESGTIDIEDAEAITPYAFDNNVTKGGFQYGVGIESTFMDGWSVRAEYNHTGFGSFSTDVLDTDVSPSDNQFMLGLIYHVVM